MNTRQVRPLCWGILLNTTLDKEEQKGQLEHAKIHLDRPVEFWKNVLWSDVTKLELFGPMDQRYVWSKKGKAYKQKNTISIVKRGGGPVLLWGCFTVAGCGYHDHMKDFINSLKYQAILARIVMLLVQRVKLIINGLSCRTIIP
ncbi:hypothetical protein M9458_054102, partial [Cirrhinus mrigala]